MGVSISTGYTNNMNYDIGSSVDQSEKGFEESHQHQEVEITNAPAPSNSQAASGAMEELDLSLEGNSNNPNNVEAFSNQNQSTFDASAADASAGNVTSTAGNSSNSYSTDSHGNLDDGSYSSKSAASGSQTNSGSTSTSINSGSDGGLSASGSSTSSTTTSTSINSGDGGTTSSNANTSTGSGNTNVNGGGEGSSNGNSTAGGTAMGGNGDGEGGSNVNAPDAPDASSAGQIVGVTSTSVSVTTQNSNGEIEVTEIPIEEFKDTLRHQGFTEADIQRVIDGVIQIVDLYNEIQMDQDSTRRCRLLEAAYINQFQLDCCDLAGLEDLIRQDQALLDSLIAQKNDPNAHKYQLLSNLMSRMRLGEARYDSPVAWQYIDEKGQVQITYDDPYRNFSDSDVEFTPLSFEDLFPGDPDFAEFKSITEIQANFLNPAGFMWTDSEEQIAFNIKIAEIAGEMHGDETELQAQIETVYQRIQTQTYIHDYIEGEITYFKTYIDPYVGQVDFLENSENHGGYEDTIEFLNQQCNASFDYGYVENIPFIYVGAKENVIDVIAAMLNGDISKSGIIFNNNYPFTVSSLDPVFQHFTDLMDYITDDEIAIFNYIYNTQGVDAAYEFLDGILPTLDLRNYHARLAADTEWAEKHPILASIYSVFVTPFEGLSAFAATASTLANEGKIWRYQAYSKGDVYRNAVAASIAVNSPTLSFIYSTGMSMVDSAMLIGVGFLTGGVGVPVISAALMGSRAFVSTLNDALDRGINDSSAFLLSCSAAVIETAMESWSASHLLHLDSALEKSAINLTGKIAGKLSNPALDKIVTKAVYVFSSAVSQALVEGEEEFATEILNYVADVFIAKDLSKFEKSLVQYMDMGYSEDAACLKTLADFNRQALEAFLGGFVSGFCFGSFSGVHTTTKVSKAIASDICEDFYAETDAMSFVKTLQLQDQQVQERENAIDKVFDASNPTLTNIDKVMKGFKKISSKILGLNSVSIENINIAIANKSITAEQGSLLLQGTMLERVVEQLKSAKKIVSNLLKQSNDYSYEGITSASGLFGSINSEYHEQVMEDLRYAVGQLMCRFNCSYYAALYSIGKGIDAKKYENFTSLGNSRARMQKHSFESIDLAYKALLTEFQNKVTNDVELAVNSLVKRFNYTEEKALGIIIKYSKGEYGLEKITSLNNARNIMAQYAEDELEVGIKGYLELQTAISQVNYVIKAYKKAYPQFSTGNIIHNIQDYLLNDNLERITKSGGARDMIAKMDKRLIAAALSRIDNSVTDEVTIQMKQENQVDQKIVKLVEDIKQVMQNRGGSYEAVSFLKNSLIRAVMTKDAHAIAYASKIVSIMKSDPTLTVVSHTAEECYWSSSRNHVHMSPKSIEIADTGTLFHEFGHALFDKVLHGHIPTSNVQLIFNIAQKSITNNRSQYETSLRNINKQIYLQAKKNLESDLIAKGSSIKALRRQLTAEYQQVFNIQNALVDNLRKMGRGEKYIKEVATNIKSVQEAVESDIQARIGLVKDQIWRINYSPYVGISDTMDALFAGNPVDLKGKAIFTTYQHGSKYYQKSSDSLVARFHEMIANYCSVRLSMNTAAMQLYESTFGTDFTKMMENTFQQMTGNPIPAASNPQSKFHIHYNPELQSASISLESIDIRTELSLDDVQFNKEQILKVLENRGIVTDENLFAKMPDKAMSVDNVFKRIVGQYNAKFKDSLMQLLKNGMVDEFNYATKIIREFSNQIDSMKTDGIIYKSNIDNIMGKFDTFFFGSSCSNIIAYANSNISLDVLLGEFKESMFTEIIDTLKSIDAQSDEAIYQSLIRQLQQAKDFIPFSAYAIYSSRSDIFNRETTKERDRFAILKDIRNIFVGTLYRKMLSIGDNFSLADDIFKLVAELERYEFFGTTDIWNFGLENHWLVDTVVKEEDVRDFIMENRKSIIGSFLQQYGIDMNSYNMKQLVLGYPFHYSTQQQNQDFIVYMVNRINQASGLTYAEILEYSTLITPNLSLLLQPQVNGVDTRVYVQQKILQAKKNHAETILSQFGRIIPEDQFHEIVSSVVDKMGIYTSNAAILELAVNEISDTNIKTTLMNYGFRALLGNFITPEVMQNIKIDADTTYGAALKDVYAQLLANGISAEDIISRIANNVMLPNNLFNQKTIRDSAKVLVEHLLTYTPEYGENGGGHYNSALLNAISKQNWQFVVSSKTGELLDSKTYNGGYIFRDANTEPHMKTIFPDAYSIQRIIDVGVASYIYGLIDENNIRLNGNYLFHSDLPDTQFVPIGKNAQIVFVYDVDNDTFVSIFPRIKDAVAYR